MNLDRTDAPREAFSIHPQTLIGQVSLTVASLEQQIGFYQQVLGFSLRWREGNQAALGAGGSDLLHLVEQPQVRRYRRVTGLYHFAVLFPDQREIARAIARLMELRYPNYPTDHVMTKTTYLDDPEGNGIELYAESPEDGQWSLVGGRYITRRTDGSLSNGREPLDLQALFSRLQPGDALDAPLPPQTRIGHVHLHVHDLDEAVRFYHGLLGFDNMGVDAAIRMGFVSAGGYHHHIGLNTWQGEGAPPPPPDALSMRYFSVVLPTRAELDQLQQRLQQAGVSFASHEEGLLLRDPSHNGVLLSAA
ncbi:MAG: VOC family protein [Chloroflexota bacterium]